MDLPVGTVSRPNGMNFASGSTIRTSGGSKGSGRVSLLHKLGCKSHPQLSRANTPGPSWPPRLTTLNLKRKTTSGSPPLVLPLLSGVVSASRRAGGRYTRSKHQLLHARVRVQLLRRHESSFQSVKFVEGSADLDSGWRRLPHRRGN